VSDVVTDSKRDAGGKMWYVVLEDTVSTFDREEDGDAGS
jgi:hypothetical protein